MKILILGSTGLVGSSLVRLLAANEKYEVTGATRNDANLFSFEETSDLVSKINPDILINAAAKVGGIHANNSQRTDFILENLKINMNILESVIEYPKLKLINLGSSCIYPLGAENPINENSLMTGKLEPTNSPYAMAKLTAIELGDALRLQYGHKVLNIMPTNLYGPNDNFSEVDSHVIPGLIRRLVNAHDGNEKIFQVWGTGNPLREFLHVDDLTNAIGFFIENEIFEGLFNVGSGEEISISDLVNKIKEIVGFEGAVSFDDTKPDGNPRKLLDSKKIKDLGWKPQIDLDSGLKETYDWFISNRT